MLKVVNSPNRYRFFPANSYTLHYHTRELRTKKAITVIWQIKLLTTGRTGRELGLGGLHALDISGTSLITKTLPQQGGNCQQENEPTF